MLSETYYKKVFDACPQMLFILSSNRKILAINAKVQEILEYSKKDLLNKDFASIIKRIPQNKQDILLLSSSEKLARLLIKKNGNEVPSMLSLAFIESDLNNSKIIATADIYPNIHRLKETINKSETKLQKIIDHMPVMLTAFNNKREYIVWSKECERVTGFTAEEMLYNKEALRLLYPNKTYFQSLEKKWLIPAYKNLESSIKCKNGKTKIITWYKGSDHVMIPGWHSWGIGLDITDKKYATKRLTENENKFQILFNTSQDSIMTLKPKSKFLNANPATLKMFCCKDEKEFREQTPAILSPKYQPDGELSEKKAKRMIDFAIKEGSYFFEWKHRRLNGNEFYATVLLTPLKLNGETLIQATVRDITKRKLIEEERKQQQKDLESSNIALRNVLRHIEEEKQSMKKSISINIERNIIPYIEKLKTNANINKDVISELEKGLFSITSNFYQKVASYKFHLTPTEIKICQHIRSGYIAKEIARLLNISISTVQDHKSNIRRKLNLTNSPINLKTFLSEISE